MITHLESFAMKRATHRHILSVAKVIASVYKNAYTLQVTTFVSNCDITVSVILFLHLPLKLIEGPYFLEIMNTIFCLSKQIFDSTRQVARMTSKRMQIQFWKKFYHFLKLTSSHFFCSLKITAIYARFHRSNKTEG